MARVLILVLIIGLCLPIQARAIGIVTSGTDLSNFTYTYNTTAPSTSGWNYVGEIEQYSGGTASGVYLGNGWVLTAAHVGPGVFVLNGTSYYGISSSAISNLTYNDQTADLTLFQISTRPNLPPLTLSTTDPTQMSSSAMGSSVTMIGYGGDGPTVETWGTNTVTFNNSTVSVSYTVNNVTYNPTTNDFITVTNSFTDGTVTSQNKAQVVLGDSGGGDFIYNSATKKWELAGINEVNGTADVTDDNNVTTTYTISGMVQLDSYAGQINNIVNPTTDTPTLPLPALLLMGFLLFLFASRAIRTNQA